MTCTCVIRSNFSTDKKTTTPEKVLAIMTKPVEKIERNTLYPIAYEVLYCRFLIRVYKIKY